MIMMRKMKKIEEYKMEEYRLRDTKKTKSTEKTRNAGTGYKNTPGYISAAAINNYRPLLIGLLFLFLAAPQMASATIQKLGHIGNGNTYDMAEANGYLYVGQGTEVRTYDVSSPDKITQLDWKGYTSKIDTEYLVKALYIDSNYLYVASTRRLTILDISNPSMPSVVSSIEPLKIKYAELRDVIIKGNYAFLSGSEEGIAVVDISDKKNPAVVSTLKLAGYNRPWRLAVSGNYLYVVSETDNRLDILDITNPANPSLKGSFSANAGTNSFSGVDVKGNYAYVTEYHNGVHVIDISNPANPVKVTSLMDMNANDIKIMGNYAYVSVRYQGFNIIDISNPSSITVVGQGTGIEGYNEGILPTSTYTYLASESKGFGIYDTSDVTKPKLIVNVPVIGGTDSVAIKDNYMYIGAHNDGVWVVDVSDPAKPQEVAFVKSGGRNEKIDVQGNYLYAAADWSSLNAIDITKPVDPNWIVSNYGSNIDRLLADGDYLYTSVYYPGNSLGIVDITDPAKPVKVSETAFGISITRFAKYGQYLLAATAGGTNKGLNIFDISNKANPVLVTTLNNGTPYKDVAINGNVAVALTGNDLVTLDISNPANPVLLGKASYPGEWAGYAVSVYNNIAYAAGGPSGSVRAFDISDPANIKLTGTFDLPEYANDIRYSNGKLYVADDKAGAYILSSNEGSDPGPAPTATAAPKVSLTPTPTTPPTASLTLTPTTTPTLSPTPDPTTVPDPSPSGTIYHMDVESGSSGWRTSGLWQITNKRYHSYSHSFLYGNENSGTYDNGKANSGNLVSPVIDLQGSKNPVLTFWSWYQTENGLSYDKKLLMISVNDGPWTTIKQMSHTQNTWVQQSINLANYAGKKIQIMFVFDTVDSYYNDYEGWYVDDIDIKEG